MIRLIVFFIAMNVLFFAVGFCSHKQKSLCMPVFETKGQKYIESWLTFGRWPGCALGSWYDTSLNPSAEIAK